MSENENKAAETAKTAKPTPAFEATLERGETFTIAGHTFRKGVPVPVGEKFKALLEEVAFDDVSVGNEGEEQTVERRPRFKFARHRAR